MLLRIAVTALAATLCFSLSARDKDHKVDFEQVKFEASGRNSRHIISTAKEPIESYAYLYGKAKLVDGKSGKALDLSDSRTRTELKLRSGHFYDHNKGSISFWLSPKKAGFGVKEKETAIFEESNGDTIFGLYVDKYGKLKVKVSAKIPIVEKGKEIIYDEKYFKKQDHPTIKFETKTIIDQVAEDKKNEEDAAEKALLPPKPTFTVREYAFHSFQMGDTSTWKEDSWNHISVSYDLRRGFFVLLVNGKYAIRSFASEGNSLGLFLNRGKVGKYIVFGPGNNGFSAAVDEIVISKNLVDKEFKMVPKK